MSEIRELSAEDLAAHTEIAFHAYPSFKDFSPEGKLRFTNRMQTMRVQDPQIKFYGLFEEDKLIAQMRLLPFEMNLFGKMTLTAGLGSLGVHLFHKKQGIGHKMLAYFEDYFREKNIPLAMLLPFEPSFYHQAEYGYGTKLNHYCLATPALPKYKAPCHLVYLTSKDESKLRNFHEKIVQQTHGMAKRYNYEWQDIFTDPENILVASLNEAAEIEGYLVFQFKNTKADNYTRNQIVVKEMLYQNPLVLRKLLGFLRNQDDQAQSVQFKTFEPGFHFLFDNPLNDSRNFLDFGYLETNQQYIGNMYKILDIPAIVQQTQHRNYNSADLSVAFTISDGYRKKTAEYQLLIEQGKARLLDSSKTAEISVALSLADFTSAFVGAVSFNDLYRMGQLQTEQPQVLLKLDQAFYLETPPVGWSDY
ncbi:GNAT family N-acetyltransferase [Enterococcus sp. 669A]|uniref:GNAT family N-acetyltransferase n=1 Tax=Candidatus Enterococcus moelleringii TaxID=2815325 RepID=A0ABS3L7R7_9ENTE|nr:GNAT family N-acetyltransferase [Enterococcus sp. 669A]MBO1305665.1 GNAT family N-acetyltransferase [Enterococcus sp. 669A]